MDVNGQLRNLYLEQVAARPRITLYEGWVDEAGIDLAIWTVTNSAGGPGWSRGASGAYLRATESPALNNVCRLVSDQRWIAAPDIYSNNTILRRTILEFELKLTNVSNIDNANSFLGLTPTAADDRTSNNIIGWALTSDALQSLTKDVAVETTNTDFHSVTLEATWNKLLIDIYGGHADFYVNGCLHASHTTNLPDYPMYLNYYIDSEATGAATIEIGIVRIWYEDILR